MKRAANYFVILSSVFAMACNYRVDKNGSQGNPSQSKTTALDFKTVEAQIFAPRCVSCHAQYSNYASVKFELNSIVEQVSVDRMPKSGPPLNDELKSLLKAWVDGGATETSQSSAQPPTEFELKPEYNSIAIAIFGPKCVACHSPTGQAKFLDLSTRLSIFSKRNEIFGAGAGQKLIDFDKPSESYLINVLQDPDEPMPPKWSGLTRLTPKEISTIEEWIRLGLPER